MFETISPVPVRTFVPWPKIPRLNRGIIITEKLDGTNACVVITEEGDVYAQSRSRIIIPGDDNYGFAGWVDEYRTDLLLLGEGRHYGEWWGQGIQRRYGLDEKRFSLFNTSRWHSNPNEQYRCVEVPVCHVVPVLDRTQSLDGSSAATLERLRENGSYAAEGYNNPEGIVVFHAASRGMYKVTLDKDEVPKGNVDG